MTIVDSSWSDEKIIEFLKQYWGCDEFVFDCRVTETPILTSTPEKYKGAISSMSYDGKQLSYPNSKKGIYINIPSNVRVNIPAGKYKLRFNLLRREIREKSNNLFLLVPDYNSFRELNIEKVRKIQQQKAEEGKVEYSDKEKDLFERWGVKDCKFIGKYSYDLERNLYIVDDIRKPNFARMSYYPNDATKSPIVIKFPFKIKDVDGTELPLNEYYLFNWKFSEQNPRNPYEIHIDLSIPPQRIRPHWFIDQLFYDRYNDVSKNFDTATNFLDTLSKQLSAKDSTFIYELLQNADDYPEEGETVDVEFHITKNYLIFMHSGAKFNIRNISGICGVNEKEKSANKKTIGYKGIGFKTVFHQNHYVYIQTGDYSFRFEERADVIKRQEAPWPILPIWTALRNVPEEVAEIFNAADPKFRVKIALRPDDSSILHSGRLNYESLFSDLFADSNLILFTQNIRSVNVYIDSDLKRECYIDDNRWVVSDYDEPIDEELQKFINKDIETGRSRIPEKYKDFEATKVSFACRKEGRKLLPIEGATLYCYLPTSASWGFPFLLNTDMIPKGDRNDIEREVFLKDSNETNFNFQLARIAGRKFFTWIQDLLRSGIYDYESIFSLIPDFSKCINEHKDYEEFIESFRNGFEELLESEQLIPIVQDSKLCYAKVADIIYDTTGFSCSGLATDKEILNISDWSDAFPHPLLRDFEACDLKPAFKNFMEIYHSENQEYDVQYLVTNVEYDDFQSWLEVRKNNDGFVRLLIGKNIIDSFSESTIFLANDNALYSPEDLYYDVSDYYEDISYLEDYLTRLSDETKNLFVGNSVWEQFSSYFREFNPDDFVDDVLLDDSYFGDVHDILMSADTSLRFMHFLSEHVGYVDQYSRFPFLDESGDVVDSFEEREFTFLPSVDMSKLRLKEWVDSNKFAIVSPKYDEKSLAYIREHFGVLEFTTQLFIDRYICSGDYVDEINDLIQKWTSNKDFVEYLFLNQNFIRDGALSSYYVGSVDDIGEEQYDLINDTYLYLRDLKDKFDFASLPWVDRDMFAMVRDDYFTDANRQKLTLFFEKAYEIPVLNSERFVEEVLENNVDDINNYIMDTEDANFAFWKWVKDTFGEREKLPLIFQKFPVLAKSLEDESLDYYTTEQNNIFLSSAYQVSDDFEKIVSRYVPDTLFVAPYMENKTQANIKAWMDFWGKVGIKTTIADLVLDKIIYYLDEIQEEGLPDLLGQYYTEIQERWDDIKSELLDIQLKTRGGAFVGINGAIVIDVNKEKEPFESIIIKDEVDPAIIGNRYTRKLLLDIAKEANSRVVENITDWQQYKINAYAGQEEEYDEDAHISFVQELAQIDIETLKRFDNLGNVRLLDRKANYVTPSELTLGTLYKPECDFEKFGIECDYISDKYSAVGIETSLITLISKGILNVHYKFTKEDISYLVSYDFALYFWRDYVRSHQIEVSEWIEGDLFTNIVCIPTVNKRVCSPESLYSRKIGDFVVNKIRDWESKFPSDDIPKAKDVNSDLFERLPFRAHLNLADSLDALLNIKSRERRAEILDWMLEDYTDEDSDMISAYRGSDGALWKNGKGQDVPLRKLLALSPDSKKLYEFFRDNENVLHGQYLPSYYLSDKYRGICKMMQIPIIEEDDMDFTPVSKQEEKLGKFFVSRLLIVAAIEDPKGWRKVFEKYRSKVSELWFWNCSKIAWVYSKNEAIQQSSKRFFYDNNQFYYVSSWYSRQVYGYLVDTLREYVGADLNEDQFRYIMDPDTTADDILDSYYSIRTDEFIAELAKHEISYHPEVVTIEDEDDESAAGTYQPKTVDYSAEEEGDSRASIDEESEDITEEKDITIVNEPIVRAVPSPIPEKHTKEKTLVAGSGEEVVAEHYRSGTWVEGYTKEDGTYVSGHYRSNSIVSEHTRDVPETTRTTNSGKERTHDHTSEGGEQKRTAQSRSTSGRSSAEPQNSNWKREPHNYSKEELENMRSKGSPLELTTLPPTKEEIEILGRCGISPEHISDTNYIAQLRLYQNLQDTGQEPEESLEDFIRNSGDVTEHKLKGGKYIHTCSAGRGVMYVSPSIWNKVMDDKCAICVYYGPYANQFFYINTPEDLLKLVEKDDVVIKITGQEKVNVVGALYNGLLRGVKGSAYTLIRVAAHTEMDFVFARYVGAMAEKEDGNEPLNVEEY